MYVSWTGDGTQCVLSLIIRHPFLLHFWELRENENKEGEVLGIKKRSIPQGAEACSQGS